MKESTKSKKSSKAKNVEDNVENNSQSNNNTLTGVLLVLVVLSLILNIAILLSIDNGDDSNEVDSQLNEKINSIDARVQAIDGFFVNNVPGYESGEAIENQENDNQQAQQNSNPQVDVEINIEGDPTLGNADAPITIVEYSDYECPYCARLAIQSMPQVIKDYVETGKAKIVFKDFPLEFHKNAEKISIAANCVYKELGDEKYFEMHDKIFASSGVSDSQLKDWAVELGVNSDKYDTCIADPAMSAEVQEDLREGQALGVSGAPTLFINGEKLVGAQPYNVIKQTIDSKLASN